MARKKTKEELVNTLVTISMNLSGLYSSLPMISLGDLPSFKSKIEDLEIFLLDHMDKLTKELERRPSGSWKK